MTFKSFLNTLKEGIFGKKMVESAEEIEEILPPHIFQTVQKRKNLQMIKDRFFYRPSNKVRNFDTLTISKIITPGFDIYKILELIIDTLETSVLIFVDFDFIIEAFKDEESPFKFEYASRATHVNNIFRIVLRKDAEQFLNLFKTKQLPELLVETFERHVKILNYHESSFQPYQLIACKIYISEIV